jgi:hypothetical protein
MLAISLKKGVYGVCQLSSLPNSLKTALILPLGVAMVGQLRCSYKAMRMRTVCRAVGWRTDSINY